jgi:hypothetical protein
VNLSKHEVKYSSILNIVSNWNRNQKLCYNDIQENSVVKSLAPILAILPLFKLARSRSRRVRTSSNSTTFPITRTNIINRGDSFFPTFPIDTNATPRLDSSSPVVNMGLVLFRYLPENVRLEIWKLTASVPRVVGSFEAHDFDFDTNEPVF